MELISGGNTVRLMNLSGINQEVKISDKISGYNPNNWNTFRVDKIGTAQTLYVNNQPVLQTTINKNTEDFGLTLWANHSGTNTIKYYIDDVSIKSIDDTVPASIGEANEIYSQAEDLMDPTNITWTGNGNTVDGGSTSLGNDVISMSKSGTDTTKIYANRALVEAGEKMLLEFDMDIPSYSAKNSVMIGNRSYRAELQFSSDHIGAVNDLSSVEKTKADIGSEQHNWKILLWDNIAKIYMDNTFLTRYRMYHTKSTDPSLLQISCHNSAGETAAVNIRNLTVRNLTGSVVVNKPVPNSFDASVQTSASEDYLIENYSSFDSGMTIILAAYTGTGSLQGFNHKNITISANTVSEFSVQHSVDTDTAGTRAFVLSNLENLIPYTKSVQASGFCFAPLSLPSVFASGSVIQRDEPVKIWGKATTGKTVTVTLDDKDYIAVSDENGDWSVTADAITTAGNPYTMTISTGAETVSYDNILAGDVWLCSGQSNMAWYLENTDNAAEDIANSENNNIRLFSQSLNGSTVPLDDVKNGKWSVCSPETVAQFSAVGYLFGRELEQDLQVPIGLINASYGGSRGEAWVSAEALAGNPEIAYSKFFLINDTDSLRHPTRLYNAMLSPIIPYGIKGAIWYQGEGNTPQALYEHYETLQHVLLNDWREKWDKPELPFIFAQLSAWDGGVRFENIREQQASFAKNSTNTAMAVTIDAGDHTSIHPTDKATVAHRMALAAKNMVYGIDIPYKSPSAVSKDITDGTVTVVFDETGDGLTAEGEVKGFELCGSDGVYYSAQASIVSSDTVEVTCTEVSAPVGIRYGFAPYPEVNLYNSYGLPAIPFRMNP